MDKQEGSSLPWCKGALDVEAVMSETFTILKRYRVLQGKPVTEPMDDMDEDKFYGGLRAVGTPTRKQAN